MLDKPNIGVFWKAHPVKMPEVVGGDREGEHREGGKFQPPKAPDI